MTGNTRDMLLPQLAMGMAEGSIAEWLVAEGAEVGRDQPMVSIETEKVVTELPAPTAGFVHLVAQIGEKLPVELGDRENRNLQGGVRRVARGRRGRHGRIRARSVSGVGGGRRSWAERRRSIASPLRRRPCAR